MQMGDEVSNGGQGSGGCRMADEVRRVPVQTADKVAEVSGAHSRQSCGGFRYKSLPRSSKLLGMTHEFILHYLTFSCSKSDRNFDSQGAIAMR